MEQTHKSLFDRFADAVVVTDSQNAELDKWAFATMPENTTDADRAFRDMYIRVLDYEPGNRFYDMSMALLSASLAAGNRHARVPLQLMDSYMLSISDEAFNDIIDAMIGLLESHATASTSHAREVQSQQELIYWLAYSSAVSRIPFPILDKLKGIQLKAAAFDEEDVQYIKDYKELYGLQDDVFMLFAVSSPAEFYDPEASEDDDDDYDWGDDDEDEDWADDDDDEDEDWEDDDYDWEDDDDDDDYDWEDDDDPIEDIAPTLMDAIREDEPFDRL